MIVILRLLVPLLQTYGDTITRSVVMDILRQHFPHLHNGGITVGLRQRR